MSVSIYGRNPVRVVLILFSREQKRERASKDT